ETSYPDLLHGQSFWSWLPPWLQGSFIGSLVVVPVGLVLRAGNMFKAAPGVSREWDFRQLIAMAMSVVIAVAGATTAGGVGNPQSPANETIQPVAKSYEEVQQALAGPKPRTPPTAEQVANRLDQLF